jgi:hypothetical protein
LLLLLLLMLLLLLLLLLMLLLLLLLLLNGLRRYIHTHEIPIEDDFGLLELALRILLQSLDGGGSG